MNTDPFGNPTGHVDGYGAGVDMGDGVHMITNEYRTVRLPDNLTDGVETWSAVIAVRTMRLPDGRYGRLLTLTHKTVDVIEVLDGSGYLWINKVESSASVMTENDECPSCGDECGDYCYYCENNCGDCECETCPHCVERENECGCEEE